jgi:hypothetical protein
MANVALFDSSGGNTNATLTIPSGHTKIYVGALFYRTSAQAAAEVGFDGGWELLLQGTLGDQDGPNIASDGTIAGNNDYLTSPGTFTSNTWHTLEMFWDTSLSTVQIAIDGVAGTDTYGPFTGENIIELEVGQVGATSHAGQGIYMGETWVGTDAGLHDILREDWSGGTFANWTSTFGGTSIVAAPSTPPAFVPTLGGGGSAETGPPGVSFAFTDGPLTDPVTWTRIDNLDGVHIQSITIHRGRSNERDKTSPGTVTIQGVDTKGVLDPTNTAGAYYGNLVPVKQAAVSLYNPDTKDWHWLFRGYIDTISYTLHEREEWFDFEITLTDMLDMLNDAEITPDQAGNTVPSESVGDCFYTGQSIQDRLLAVLADSSTAFMAKIWPTTLLEVATGNVNVQGRVYSNRTSLLQVIDEACDAEYPGSTNRFITFDGSFAFRGRYYRFVPTHYIPADNTTRQPGTEMLHWSVGDYPSFEADNTLATYRGLKYQVSKTDLINLALVTPIGISDSQLASGTQFKSDATSVDAYGPRTSGMSLENLITGDDNVDGNSALQETASFAEATVHNYKDPPITANEITFTNAAPGDGDYERRWKLLCGIELSDLVTVWSKPKMGGGFNLTTAIEQDHFVEELVYDLKPLQGDEWDVTLTVTLTSRHHFRYIPASWTPPTP